MSWKIVFAAIVGTAAIGASRSPLRAQQVAPPQQMAAPMSSRSVRDGVYTEEQAKRGGTVYGDECGRCHGPALDGGESAPLIGDAFAKSWNGSTLDELFDRIKTSMPQDDPGRLSAPQTADVLAYILNANKCPTGKTELAQEKTLLKAIRFEAAK